ncbi:MAG: PorP/SprF family type IX secretion system membrane protein [Bacteroidota bacterium]
MRKLIILLNIFALPLYLSAQQNPVTPLFHGTQFGWNPGMTASWNYLEANATYTQQFAGFDQAPNQISLGIQYPFESLNMGVGLQLLRDETGPLQQTGVHFAYAYHIPLGYNHRLSVGISARISQLRYDPSEELAVDPTDPLLSGGIANAQHYNLSAGAFYRTADMDDWTNSHFFAGLSVQQAIPQDLLLVEDISSINFRREWHAFALAGYRFDLEGAFIEPSLQLDYAFENVFLPRFNIIFEMEQAFWAGLSMDGSFSASLQLGYIINTGNFWDIRLGAFASRNVNQQSFNLGNSYGLIAAYRFEL